MPQANKKSTICVLADDFTGAAELCGVALRYGLSAEVQPDLDLNSGVAVLCVDAHTRSCSPQETARRARAIGKALRGKPPLQIYKKIDSLLRGPLVAEVEALLDVLGLRRAILVPANPGRKRVIREGRYFVEGHPLDETPLINDPDFLAHSSEVTHLLGPSRTAPIRVCAPKEKLPAEGIIIGEAATPDDLIAWSRLLDESTLPGGAAEFFGTHLQCRCRLSDGPTAPFDEPVRTTSPLLFVSGSASSYARGASRRFQAFGIPVLRMPAGLLEVDAKAESLIRHWADSAVAALAGHDRVLITIDQPYRQDARLPRLLLKHLARLVHQILRRTEVGHLCVEGGTTASALVQSLQFKRLRALKETAPGIVTLRVDPSRRFFTVKPGSYEWPDSLLGDLPPGPAH